MKRVFIILFSIVLTLPLCVVCFADGGFVSIPVTTDSYFESYFNVSDVSMEVVYTSASISTVFFNSNSGNVLRGNADFPIYGTLRFINEGSDTLILSVHYTYITDHYSTVTVYPNSYVDLSFGSDGYEGVGTHPFLVFDSVTVTDDGYSVFNGSFLISNLSDMWSFVKNNSTLLGLLLIGVTLSLGFVAVKFIRRVMWGN